MSAFSIVAEGGAFKADRDEIRRAATLLFGAGEYRELRALPSTRSKIVTVDEPDTLVESAYSLSDGQVYWSLNPISKSAVRASKKTVLSREWFLIDIDTVKPPDVSASDTEKSSCGNVSVQVMEHLLEIGWPAPVVVDSGNGWHLLYKIKLPNDPLSQQILKSAIYALAGRFDTAEATIDKHTHDAPRISKLPGTWARRGPDTKDRPHRLARITYAPDTIETVTIEQLQAIAEQKEPAPVMVLWAANGPGMTAYVSRAIEGECGKVAMATPGTRNNVLNTSAFKLATMAAWPEMSEAAAKDALGKVASLNGLDGREIAATLNSAWTAGKAQPRPREYHQRNGTVKPIISSRLCIKASEIKPRVVEWLWPNRIAVGFITLFAGRTGVGKSFVLCDFIARLTTGRALPDAQNGKPPANVLMISEDPYDFVLAPRFIEMKADLDRISFLTWEAMAAYTLANVEMLDRAYDQADSPLLVAIDPPTNFLGGKADEHKNSEVRQILMGIVAWLNSKSVACVMITHVNKQIGKGVEAIDRIMGSVAWASTSRVALGFAPDPNDASRCLFAGIKNNLGPKAETLAYAIQSTADLATVEWRGKVDTTANEAFDNAVTKSVSESLESWMEERFREKRRWLQQDLKEYAMASGFSFNAFRNYKKGIKKRQVADENGVNAWFWEALYGWPPLLQETNDPADSAECGHLSPYSVSDNPQSDKSSVIGICRLSPESAVASGSIVGIGIAPQGLKGAESAESTDTDRGNSVASVSLNAALRWLATILQDKPIPRASVHELGNALLLDGPTLDQAASRLGVERTFDDGKEMWSFK